MPRTVPNENLSTVLAAAFGTFPEEVIQLTPEQRPVEKTINHMQVNECLQNPKTLTDHLVTMPYEHTSKGRQFLLLISG